MNENRVLMECLHLRKLRGEWTELHSYKEPHNFILHQILLGAGPSGRAV